MGAIRPEFRVRRPQGGGGGRRHSDRLREEEEPFELWWGLCPRMIRGTLREEERGCRCSDKPREEEGLPVSDRSGCSVLKGVGIREEE